MTESILSLTKGKPMRRSLPLLAAVGSLALLTSCITAQKTRSDLNPVTLKKAPRAEPVVLVENGEAKATIVVMGKAGGARDLQKYIAEATGAKLPIVKDKISRPAIVLGECPESRAIGLDASKLPREGFAIKTAPGAVFIVGQTNWGACEFLERFVGMRWYWALDHGRCIPKTVNLSVPPVHLEDAPVFRMRVIWPPCSNPWNGSGTRLGPLHSFLRGGNTWPNQLVVHSPNWSRVKEYREKRPEVYQLKRDGSRDYAVLCYGNPKTLESYLEQIQNKIDGKRYSLGIKGKAITVSPADVELACYCEDCRRLWDTEAGGYGTASKVMASFVDGLAREVKKRWPKEDFTILFLPYLNYTKAPEGFKFPDNVEVQICGMPGLATYKELAIREAEQANIDSWIKISGRKIQNWHYSCWPAHKTKAAYQYPHVVKEHYLHNRDKTVGTFINGTTDHWTRQHISLYCWMKCLWNPEFDVDAAIDEFCMRMFGPAAATMRELVGMQIDGWEKSVWPGGRLSPKGIYQVSFSRETVKKMEELLEKAREEGKGDELVTARLDYYADPLEAFFEESKNLCEGGGFQPLQIQKVGENPKLDGKLDDPEWQRATGNSFVMAKKQELKPKYGTVAKGVWTNDGVTFGFRMEEPTPSLLETKNGGHDNGSIWWDDCVEIFVDVTGKSEGEFYQFIVNPDCNYWDSKLKDTSFEAKGFKSAAHRGKDFWSLEVFLPYTAFADTAVPGSGSDTVWTGNFMRHRVADSRNKDRKPGSTREYTRMNTTGSGTSANLADFAPILFIE